MSLSPREGLSPAALQNTSYLQKSQQELLSFWLWLEDWWELCKGVHAVMEKGKSRAIRA